MKAKYFFSYVMGFTMGALIIAIIIGFNMGTPASKKQVIENIDTNYEEISVKLQEFENKINELEYENTSLLEQVESYESKSDEAIEIEIKSDMTYVQIADALIENEIYPHKNDLLMIIELLNYDKLKGAESMRSNGIIYNVNTHKELLSNLETNNDRILEALLKDGLIQNMNDFGKITYLLRSDIRINSGIKLFRKNSSLREIVDKLIE